MSPAEAAAARLASGAPVTGRVALVMAHPDDETLWAGAALPRLHDLLLIHLTDGAPLDMSDARRLGFATRDAYAQHRAYELDHALIALGATPERRSYGIVDQQAIEALDTVIDRLTTDLAGCEAVATHPYEGGHPDHDAAALAVRRVADRLGVPVVEVACYHKAEGGRRFGQFWPDPACPEHVRPLLPDEAARVDAALVAHGSQAGVFGDWRPAAERWRAAPAYDFAAPPPPGAALYDDWGWSLTSSKWRAIAACARVTA